MAGHSVFAWKGETLAEYWENTLRALSFDGGKGPNLIVDDGGDATLMIHLGYEAEDDPRVLEYGSDAHEDEIELKRLLKRILAENPRKWHTMVQDIRGFDAAAVLFSRSSSRINYWLCLCEFLWRLRINGYVFRFSCDIAGGGADDEITKYFNR